MSPGPRDAGPPRQQARPGQAAATAAALLALTALAVPWRSHYLGSFPGFLLSFGSATLFIQLVTAALLFSQAQAARDRSVADLGAAYLFSAVSMLPYLLTFPGVLGPLPVLGSPQAALWVSAVWHIGFALAVARYAWRGGAQMAQPPRLRRLILGGAGLAILLGAASIGLAPYLPVLLQGVTFSPTYHWLVVPALVLTETGALASVVLRLRGRSAIGPWLAVAMLAATLDILLTVTGGRRYTLAWYLAKALSLATGGIVLAALLTELASVFRRLSGLNAELSYAATHDPLTSLANRALFTERLAAAIARARTRPDPPYGVLFIDLDRFKLVNDSLGHRAGDRLLREIAARLARCIGPDDTLARLGGDEFAVLIARIEHPAGLTQIADRIVQATHRPLWLDDHEVFTTCSVGVVQAAADAATPEQVLRDADIAMYEAKRRGPGQYAVFEPAMHDRAMAALTLQSDLARALERQELFLVYQPICNALTGAITGVEALMRWRHPERGLVSPAAFIPVAEETGLILPIGRWLLHTACAQLRRWQTRFPNRPLRLSVNSSAVELRHPGFTDAPRHALAASGLPARALQIEVTEAIFLDDPTSVAAILAGIRALGVRVALDDFGTGYSSLGYLDRYEMDTLKIDQSFVARMLDQRRAMAIVQTIIRLGHRLDLDVVAEGVETTPQLQALRAAGCTSVQGYLLGRPMAPAALEQALSAQIEQPQAAIPALPC